MAPALLAVASRAAQARLIALPDFARARTVALYAPLGAEVGTELVMLAAREAGQRVCVPRVQEGALAFHAVETLAELVPGPLGFAEPGADSLRVNLDEIDIFVVPGVAFDLAGGRLGRGGGYYDSTLRGIPRARCLGLAYEFQIVVAVPVAPHDVRMGTLVTEARTVNF